MLDSLSLQAFAMLLFAAGYIINRIMESLGWNRSSQTLRRENEDLGRRNGELEQTVARHETKLGEQRAEIDLLTATVRDLQSRDQQAVLDALRNHEAGAIERHGEHVRAQGETNTLLTEIRDRIAPAA